jgi:hypothetical protein
VMRHLLFPVLVVSLALASTVVRQAQALTLSAGRPQGALVSDTQQVDLHVVTDVAATCRYGTTLGVPYASMTLTFATTGGTVHTTPITGLVVGQSKQYAVRCQAGGVPTTTDYILTFQVLPRPAKFTVYDALLYIGRPDTRRYGMTPFRVVYTQEFWPEIGGCAPASESGARNAADAVWNSGYRGNVTLDIECESLDIRFHELAEVDAAITFHLQMQGWFQDQRPELKTGLYYQPPISDIRGSDFVDPSAIMAANDYLEQITVQSNVLFPQCYTLGDEYSFWYNSTRLRISEARRIAGTKPVYCFIWPQFHEMAGPPLAHTPIPGGFWADQLNALYNMGADGAVIWGGYQTQWDPNAEWWQATQTFLHEKGIATVSANAAVFPQMPHVYRQRFVTADTLGTFKTLVTGGDNGTRCHALWIVSDDTTAPHQMSFRVTRAGTTYPGPVVTAPTTQVPINVFSSTAWVGLGTESESNAQLLLDPGDLLEVAYISNTIAAAKVLGVHAECWDF